MTEKREEINSYANFVVVALSKTQTRVNYYGISLTYSVPEYLKHLKVGSVCVLPLRQKSGVKNFVGILTQFCMKPDFPCVNVISHVHFTINFSENIFLLLNWVSDYYLYSMEPLVPLLAPSILWNLSKHEELLKRIQKNFVQNKLGNYQYIEHKNIKKIKGEIDLPSIREISLNTEQQAAYDLILAKENSVSLLHGVTGAGKTEVYLKLAQTIIKNGRTVLILVPEIALTPQMSARFRALFSDQLAVLHSGLTKAEYEREWFKIHFNLARIVLGVRTCIFSPLANIGLIIVDEEHDSSYKTQDFPIYHARDVAVVRAKFEKAICVLGSATPSVESFFNAKFGKYNYYKINNKFSNGSVDHLVVDVKKSINLGFGKKQNYMTRSSQMEFKEESIAPEICSILRNNKMNGMQSMVIVNRRGYYNYAFCVNCSYVLSCPNCSVTTTLHNRGEKEICHYCGFQVATRKSCPQCASDRIVHKGIGTQNIEEVLQNLIPELKIARLDRDVLTSNSRLTEIINDFRLGHTDCLVGTQMLAKGHDFPKVTVVVILHLEDGLFLPDFRSAERTFQLLTQATGRAGRGGGRGMVVLQSFVVGHPVIELSLANKIDEFLERELKMRRLGFHPPFSRQILFEIRHKKKDYAMEKATKLQSILTTYWQECRIDPKDVRLAGPYFATLERLQDEYRVQLCVSIPRSWHPSKILSVELIKSIKSFARVDVDPYSFL